MSYAICWRQTTVVCKLTLVGLAGRVDRAMAEALAQAQASSSSLTA
jgi:hypothetical protein